MAPASRECERSSKEEASGSIQATLRVELDPAAHCAVVEEHQSAEPVRQALIEREAEARCRVELTDRDGDRVLMEDAVTAHCVCPLFHAHDCIAEIDGCTDGQLLISLSVPDRDELREILGSLRETGATPRLTQITGGRPSAEDPTVPLEIESLTEKQREAVRIAVDSGYYETPRRASLKELAEQLDISRSAVSQRLVAVETKLVTSLHESVGSGLSIPSSERTQAD